MKLLAVLAALIAAANAQSIRDDSEGWYVPQLDGSVVFRPRDVFMKTCGGYDRFDFNPVNYYLYTNADPLDGKKLNLSLASLVSSPYKKGSPTIFVIHGWTGAYDQPIIYKIIKAWLGRGDFNLISVDWARARYTEYCGSYLAVRGVGNNIGKMINLLTSSKLNTASNIHLIGFDLGAHIAGYAGKYVGDGKIKTITGLDPALPGFVHGWSAFRLHSTDAEYVETIVTSGGLQGLLKPIGKAVFYVNGGEHQPGCIVDIFGICAHERAVTYYAEAVQHNHFGTYKCPHYQTALHKNCTPTFSNVRMGNTLENPGKANGIYYVPIKSKHPFGISPSS
ncbi:phospholipase A1 isoform X1 [Drosophila willistoni]|uniref:phospholipase A1 isoform X2 n=1 Tax=Drosophila willistoni TaxID=7260 RepID=UPI00017D894D|nr:phospholipase A1 isoform X2 [Drosophila willistoni]XP_046869497.1 phospholipase A1 isoform X1 [Drosophila willistoni]